MDSPFCHAGKDELHESNECSFSSRTSGESAEENGISDIPSRSKFVKSLSRLQNLFDKVCEKRGNSKKERAEFGRIVTVLKSYVEWIDELNDEGMEAMFSISEDCPEQSPPVVDLDLDRSVQTDDVAPVAETINTELVEVWEKRGDGVETFPYVIKPRKTNSRFNLSDLPYYKPSCELAIRYPEEKSIELTMIRQQLDFWKESYKIEKTRVRSSRSNGDSTLENCSRL